MNENGLVLGIKEATTSFQHFTKNIVLLILRHLGVRKAGIGG
jgi:hypothetical protein